MVLQHATLNLLLLIYTIIPPASTSASLPPTPPINVIRNLARGSALKIAADLSGGLPFEIWKSSVILEHSRRSTQQQQQPNQSPPPVPSDIAILSKIINSRGPRALWSGCTPRLAEGFFSGAVLLAAKETLRKTLTPITPLPPSIIGFVAGAGGGAAQAIVMAPCSMLVTAAADGRSVRDVLKDIRSRGDNNGGLFLGGIYRGSSAVAARQATNWASRQGFTELVRPRLRLGGVPGEIVAGCVGGALACWNTPFEVSRIEVQNRLLRGTTTTAGRNDSNLLGDGGDDDQNLFETMRDIVEKRGVAGLYTGLLPRVFQSCYQTVFLVCVPRLLDT